MIQEIKSIIANEKIVPVVKLDRVEDAAPLMKALVDGGINVAEITYRTAAGAPAIEIISKEFPSVCVGAGTIINEEQCKDAIKRGAKFIVSPGFSKKIAKVCAEKDVLYVSGCVTPTEIMKAVSCGLDIVKFFPSESFGGLKTIKALAAPFVGVKFMPTGGVSQNNIKEYLSCDKIVACGGTWMVKSDLISNGDFDKITELSKEAKEMIK